MKIEKNTIAHICQNCGADLHGNNCSNCGQKSTAFYDKSITSMVEHFFEEIFVWDSRFFRSVKYLFTKPGFLTHEYISGRIQSYISPLKMFLFTSFVLFFIIIKSDPDQYNELVTKGADDDFMEEFIIEQQQASDKSNELYIESFNNQFNDNITLYIFVIMFIFSVLLKIVYFSKNYFYAEHIVFTLHFFTFVLWCFLLALITQGLGVFFLFFFIYIVPAFYLFIAIKKVYHKTFIMAVLVSVFMTFFYWILSTMWMFGTMFISAVRAA